MKENKMTAIQKSFVALATEKHGENAILSRKEMNDVCNENGLPTSAWRPVKEFKVGHGQYQLPSELRRSGPLGDFANEALYEWNTYRNAAAADRAGMAHDLIRTIDTPSHPGMSLGEMMFQTP